jgi:hypothetical protein
MERYLLTLMTFEPRGLKLELERAVDRFDEHATAWSGGLQE